jgi:alkylation response protein AidB-like acyl-CoA dehydrogenase
MISGSKIWTSYGEHADYCELLVRTDRDAERHHGLSWVIVDMHSPGIEIRPITSIDGWPHNCAVFYDEVRVPLTNVVGGLGEGWRVAMTTLAAERGPGFLDERLNEVVLVDRLIEHARDTGRLSEDGVRAQLAELRAEAAAVRSMAYRQVSRQEAEGAPAADAVANRSFFVQLQMRVRRAALDLLGPETLARSDWTDAWLEGYSGPIAGGTIDIQKNIIGERVLGLPR